MASRRSDTVGDGVTLGLGVGDGVVEAEGGRIASLRSLTLSSSSVTTSGELPYRAIPGAACSDPPRGSQVFWLRAPKCGALKCSDTRLDRATRRPSRPTAAAMRDDLERVS